MLKNLTATNFGCHETLDITFTPGLNVFRAANEAGKSTVLKAVAYALWGARALPAALSDTVTWGKPLSSLKVELTFTVQDRDYHVKRSNSGAELTSEALVVTGQAETASYISTLLGATAQVAQSTLFAAQKDIESALSSNTGALIENLANLGLIGTLVERLREKHPSGATKHLEAQLNALVDMPVPEGDLNALEADLTKAVSENTTAAQDLAHLQGVQPAVLALAAEAKALLANAERNERQRQKLTAEIARTAVADVPDCPPDIAPLEQEYAAAVQSVASVEAYKRFTSFDNSVCVPVSEETSVRHLQKLRQERSGVESDLRTATHALGATENEINSAEGACTYCGLDLKDTPQFKQRRAFVISKMVDIKERENTLSECLAALNARIAALEELGRADDMNRRAMTNVTFDNAWFPAKPVWQGDVPTQVGNIADIQRQLLQRRTLLAEWNRLNTANEKAKTYLASLHAALSDLPVIDVSGADAAISDAQALQGRIATVTATCAAARQVLQRAERAKAEFIGATQTATEVNQRNSAARAEITQTMRSMEAVNALIGKLRDMRPAVVSKLWKLLTTTVSAVFSQMRGVPAVVSHVEGKGFQVDGKPVEVYSGSTRDILSLALRETLVKVFLPCVDFLVLDEPAAGCDEERETALIASVAKAGFNQILLVTHSSIADSFAQNLITLD